VEQLINACILTYLHWRKKQTPGTGRSRPRDLYHAEFNGWLVDQIQPSVCFARTHLILADFWWGWLLTEEYNAERRSSKFWDQSLRIISDQFFTKEEFPKMDQQQLLIFPQMDQQLQLLSFLQMDQQLRLLTTFSKSGSAVASSVNEALATSLWL